MRHSMVSNWILRDLDDAIESGEWQPFLAWIGKHRNNVELKAPGKGIPDLPCQDAFFRAAQRGCTEIVWALYDNSLAYGHMYSQISEMTALHYAATNEDLSYNDATYLVPTLTNTGNPIDAEDMRGNTPLHLAADSGCVNMTRALVDFGADIYYRNADNATPLDVAVATCEKYVQPTLEVRLRHYSRSLADLHRYLRQYQEQESDKLKEKFDKTLWWLVERVLDDDALRAECDKVLEYRNDLGMLVAHKRRIDDWAYRVWEENRELRTAAA